MGKIAGIAGVMVVVTLLASGCGENYQPGQVDNAAGTGGENKKVVISGSISDTVPALKPFNRKLDYYEINVYRNAVGTWANALIQGIDSSGNIIATAFSDSNGNYSLSLPSGSNYFLRASIGNLVLKTFIENANSDVSNENIGPSTSAVVKVLSQMIGNRNSGEPGADVSGSIGQVDLTSTISAIKSNGNFSLLVETITNDITSNFDPDGSVPAIGSAGNAGDSIMGGIFNSVNGTDTISPTILLTSPRSQSSIDISGNVTATFSEDMTALSLTTSSFKVQYGQIPVPGTVTYTDKTVIFTPDAYFSYGGAYTAVLTSSVTDSSGNPLNSDYKWRFSTVTAPDSIAPGVLSTTPVNGATRFSTSSSITITFSESMTPGDFTTATFTLSDSVNNVPGIVTYAGTTATFTPSTDLAFETTYTATIDGAITDLTGSLLANQPGYSWSFTTINSSPGLLLSDMTFPDQSLRSCVLETGEAYAEDVKSLSCDSRNITDLSGIGSLTALTDLYLYNNQLTTLPSEIGNLTALTNLYLGTNQLTILPTEIGNLTALEYLYLNSNQLTSLPVEIGNLTALTFLLLWNNQLATLPHEIGNLTAIKYLLLWNNQLATLPPEIGTLTALTSLDFDNNQLTTLPEEIKYLVGLTALSLRNNQLTALPHEIDHLAALTTLSLGNNQLTTLPYEIRYLTALTQIDLVNNQLTTLPPEIGTLAALTNLDLQGNNNIPCADIAKIVVLLGNGVVTEPASCIQ